MVGNYLTSAATAGSLAYYYPNSAGFIGFLGQHGGWQFYYQFFATDAATVANARMFVGLRNATSAPTNVDPATLTNCIGMAQRAGVTNWQLVYGGSAAQTPIDTGLPYSQTDNYTLIVCGTSANATTCNVGILKNGELAYQTTLTGTAGVVLPADNTPLYHTSWRCNNSTALAVRYSIGKILVINYV
jgi:hypothetical protein